MSYPVIESWLVLWVKWTSDYHAYEVAVLYIDDSVQDSSNPGALAMELLQTCTKPS